MTQVALPQILALNAARYQHSDINLTTLHNIQVDEKIIVEQVVPTKLVKKIKVFHVMFT